MNFLLDPVCGGCGKSITAAFYGFHNRHRALSCSEPECSKNFFGQDITSHAMLFIEKGTKEERDLFNRISHFHRSPNSWLPTEDVIPYTSSKVASYGLISTPIDTQFEHIHDWRRRPHFDHRVNSEGREEYAVNCAICPATGWGRTPKDVSEWPRWPGPVGDITLGSVSEG